MKVEREDHMTIDIDKDTDPNESVTIDDTDEIVWQSDNNFSVSITDSDKSLITTLCASGPAASSPHYSTDPYKFKKDGTYYYSYGDPCPPAVKHSDNRYHRTDTPPNQVIVKAV